MSRGIFLWEEEQGKGYATEMAKAIIKFAYRLGIHDFMAEHAIENSSSGLVLEKAVCTLRERAVLKNQVLIWFTHQIYIVYIWIN